MSGTYITVGRPIKCRVRTIRPFCSIYSARLPVLGFILFQLKLEKTERTFSSDKKRSIFIKIARVNVISFYSPCIIVEKAKSELFHCTPHLIKINCRTIRSFKNEVGFFVYFFSFFLRRKWSVNNEIWLPVVGKTLITHPHLRGRVYNRWTKSQWPANLLQKENDLQ